MSRRPGTAAERAQKNLAGAGNLLAWVAPPVPNEGGHAAPTTSRSSSSGRRNSDAATALSGPSPSSAAAAALIQPSSAGSLLPRAHSPLRPPSSVYPSSGAAAAAPSSNAGMAFEVSFDNDSGSGGGGGAKKPQPTSAAVDSFLRQRADDALATAAEARTTIEKDHAMFQRICVHRVQEIRTVLEIWRGSSNGAVGDVVGALRYLMTYAHESIAVDVLNALAGCNDWISVPSPHHSFDAYDDDGEEGGEGGGGEAAVVKVKACGGFPQWDYDSGYASIDWLEFLAPVLESLLKSHFEDYLSVAARATGSAIEALTPLFTFAAKECCDDPAADLTEPTPPEQELNDEGEPIEPSKEAEDEYQAALKRHTAAVQAVRAVELLKPVSRALVRVNTVYEGTRPAKLCVTRYATLQQWADSTQALSAAYQIAVDSAAQAERRSAKKAARRAHDDGSSKGKGKKEKGSGGGSKNVAAAGSGGGVKAGKKGKT